jgi:succinate dehydrogenase / fumarate reductase iron-sulfur subunit
MVVLDAVHQIQAEHANDLAVRWNCKAGKCGSCSAEINGMPKLMCMTRLNTLPLDKPVTVEPMHAFPRIKDLVTDVSWNYRAKKQIKPFKPRKPDAADGTWRMQQEDVDRAQEFRKCIECYLCQDVCHVLREHHMHEEFIGPRFLVHVAQLEMNPLDTEDRLKDLKDAHGIGLCNITKCCTNVCPEGITITDNAIIPLKERVVDEFYDPLGKLFKLFRPSNSREEGVQMFELKPKALEKVERYRLLNEPAQAESICLDILRIDPDNQKALVMLLLALTDQLGSGGVATRARAAVSRLKSEYERAYYTGIICERSARAELDHGVPGAAFSSYNGFREAMEWYEKAESLRPPGNDDAVLRWNTCVRTLQKNPSLRPRPEEAFEPVLGE